MDVKAGFFERYRVRVCVLVLLCGCSTCVWAQFARIERHPVLSDVMERFVVEHVKGNLATVIRSNSGQYFGQVSEGANATGFGSFYTDQDGEVYGVFFNGSLLTGIRLGGLVAKVGTEEHYAAYDLTTGRMQYVEYGGQQFLPDAESLERCRFLQMTYPDGGKYVGETVDGKRSGFGLYYYTNGNYYFGRYEEGRPVGYGALFRTDNRVVIQRW